MTLLIPQIGHLSRFEKPFLTAWGVIHHLDHAWAFAISVPLVSDKAIPRTMNAHSSHAKSSVLTSLNV
jgi:hypothetical protein